MAVPESVRISSSTCATAKFARTISNRAASLVSNRQRKPIKPIYANSRKYQNDGSTEVLRKAWRAGSRKALRSSETRLICRSVANTTYSLSAPTPPPVTAVISHWPGHDAIVKLCKPRDIRNSHRTLFSGVEHRRLDPKARYWSSLRRKVLHRVDVSHISPNKNLPPAVGPARQLVQTSSLILWVVLLVPI